MRGRTNLKAAVIVSVFLVVVLGISGYCEAEELYIVADINPSGNSGPDYLTNVNGTLFFKARNGTHGSELWKSDGTRTGTVMVKDINPGAGSSYPSELTNVNGTLFFFADDDTSGKKLWKSDGSRIGTVMVKDINPGGGGTILAYMINVNGTLFFAAHDDTHGGELWKSDGTSIGTVMVKDINPSGNSSPRNLTVVNGTLLFTAYNDMYGFELWKSDGTEAGTVMVKDINPGASGSGFGTRYLMNFNGTLFFSADDGTHGYELWKSDVTELGTVMVKDINPGGGSSSPSYMTNVNGTLFFGASDGSDGKELWKSDGTELGTVMVADINPGAGSSAPSELTNVYGTLFFSAYNVTNGAELWKSDGTSAGTVMVKDIYATSGDNGSFPSELTNVYGTLFFMAYTSWYGGELWKSDGTEAGTVIVKDIYPGEDEAPPFDPMSSFPSGLTIDNGTLYFSANDGLYGRELWAYTHSKRIFVDADANGANNGSSWSDAYLYLQDALTQAVSYDEIFVAQGTYKPDQGGGLTTGDRTATFQLKNCVTIKGGYAGFGEPDPDVRDITAYETILSGDLAGNDFGFTKNGENSYHVVTGSGTEQSTILDGFTITAGNADGSFPNNRGGGMVNNPNGSATITNCKFGGNSALLGGGMYNFDQSSPSVTNCTFSNNSTSWGGGMYNGDNSNPTVTNCTFSNNSAATNGGGMYNYLGCDATVVNCTFSGNSASSNGGGMFNYSNTPTLTNCILWGNSDAGGMDESGQIYSHSTSIITINYSCVQGWTGGMGGVGNIGDDPLFLDADGPDDIAGTEDDNLRLRSLSPCINAGDNLALPVDVTTDLDGAPRITGRIVDMGAYEWDYLVAHWKLD